jgi:hypothetical protein
LGLSGNGFDALPDFNGFGDGANESENKKKL